MSLEDSASFIAAICSNDASYRPLEPSWRGEAAASHRQYLERTSVQLQIIWRTNKKTVQSLKKIALDVATPPTLLQTLAYHQQQLPPAQLSRFRRQTARGELSTIKDKYDRR